MKLFERNKRTLIYKKESVCRKVWQMVKCPCKMNLKKRRFAKLMPEIKEKNELDSTYGISDDEFTERFKVAIRIDEEIRKIKGLPTSGFEAETNRAYILYPDGRKEYV